MVNVWKGAPPSSFSYLHCVHLSHSIKPSSLADNTSFYLLLSPALFFPFFPHTSPLLTPANSPRPCLNLLTPPACLGLSWEPVPCHSYWWKWNKEQKKRTERCFWVHADTVWHTHTHTPRSDWNLQESRDEYWVEPNTSLQGFQPPSAAKEELIPSKQLFFPFSITKSHFVPGLPKTHLYFRTNSSPPLLAITAHQAWQQLQWVLLADISSIFVCQAGESQTLFF